MGGVESTGIIVGNGSNNTKPHKVKNLHFYSKSNGLVDLIVNKDWQRVLVRLSTHPKEVYAMHKIRLYGVNRKMLPLHLACALRPPLTVIQAMLQADEHLSTPRVLMKNYKKKRRRTPTKASKSSSSTSPNTKSSCSEYDVEDSLSGSFHMDHTSFSSSNVNDVNLSSPKAEYEVSSIMNNDDDDQYALQLTPSGKVKHISPLCTFSNNPNEMTDIHTINTINTTITDTCMTKDGGLTPESCRADDFLPLHIACLFRASPEVIEVIINAYPEGTNQPNKWGLLPIHILCANLYLQPPWIFASKLEGDTNQTKRKYLTTLYSNIDQDGQSWDVTKAVELLISASPQCIHTTSNDVENMAPIGYVMKCFPKGHQKESLLALLREQEGAQNPECTNTISSTLKKHLTIQPTERSNQLINLLRDEKWSAALQHLSKYPEDASSWILEEERTPTAPRLALHLACTMKTPREVIRSLLRAYPEGAMIKGTETECFALHLACMSVMRLDIIHELLVVYPEAASSQDIYGRLPIHLACANDAELAMVEALVCVYPEGRDVKDYNGHTPLTYVQSHDEDTVNPLSILFEQEIDKTTTTTTTITTTTSSDSRMFHDEMVN